jgi:hypothetical protein
MAETKQPNGLERTRDGASCLDSEVLGPALHIDGLADPQKRMTNYWERVHAGFRERTKEMEKLGGETER